MLKWIRHSFQYFASVVEVIAVYVLAILLLYYWEEALHYDEKLKKMLSEGWIKGQQLACCGAT